MGDSPKSGYNGYAEQVSRAQNSVPHNPAVCHPLLEAHAFLSSIFKRHQVCVFARNPKMPSDLVSHAVSGQIMTPCSRTGCLTQHVCIDLAGNNGEEGPARTGHPQRRSDILGQDEGRTPKYQGTVPHAIKRTIRGEHKPKPMPLGMHSISSISLGISSS